MADRNWNWIHRKEVPRRVLDILQVHTLDPDALGIRCCREGSTRFLDDAVVLAVAATCFAVEVLAIAVVAAATVVFGTVVAAPVVFGTVMAVMGREQWVPVPGMLVPVHDGLVPVPGVQVVMYDIPVLVLVPVPGVQVVVYDIPVLVPEFCGLPVPVCDRLVVVLGEQVSEYDILVFVPDVLVSAFDGLEGEGEIVVLVCC